MASDGKLAQTVEGYLFTAARLARSLGGLLGSHTTVERRLTEWYQRRKRECERRPEQRGSFRAELTVLRAFYTHMIAAKLYDGPNPARQLKYPKRRKDEYMPRPLPTESIAELWQQFDLQTAEGLRDRVMVELMHHGLRRIEIVRASTRDLVFTQGRYEITAHGKGAKDRIVPINDAYKQLVSAYLLRVFAPEDHREWLVEFSDKPEHLRSTLAAKALLTRRLYDEPGPLFLHRGGGMTPRELNRIFARYREAAQLPTDERGRPFGPHSLRHSCGTELLNAGEDLRKIQEILGHDDIRTTTLYTKVATEQRAGAINKLPVEQITGDKLWLTTST